MKKTPLFEFEVPIYRKHTANWEQDEAKSTR
jgi:hypothetical protein